MIKSKINYLVEVLLIICLVELLIITFFVEGQRKLHHLIGISLFILLGIHILLHLKVFWAMTKGIFK